MRYTKFGSTTLPTTGAEHDLVGDTSAMADMALPGGGMYDAWGADQADPRPRRVTLRYRIIAATVSARETTIRTWLALRGERASLYRELDDSSEQYRAARLREVGYVRRGDEGWDNISLQFQLYGSAWKGTRHYHSADLITNGEFSSDLTGWTEENNTTATQETDAGSPGDDTGVVKVVSDGGGGGVDPQVTQIVSVLASHSYNFSAQNYSPSTNTQTHVGAIYAFGDVDWTTTEDTYKFLDITAEAAADGNQTLQLVCDAPADAGDWTYFDQTVLEDLGFVLDSSPNSYEIPNDGDIACRDILITVDAGTDDITSLEIENAETDHVSHIKYTGTISGGTSLVIDCGEWTVENDGSDDFDNFSVESDHEIDEWLRLMSGDNTITITFAGGATGDNYIKFDYRDAYA